MIESSTKLCSYLERIYGRNLANANDTLRLKLAWDGYGEQHAALSDGKEGSPSGGSTLGGRPRELEEDTTLLNRDSAAFSRTTLAGASELSERSALAFQATLLEEYKLVRESWRALLDLLNRYETHLKRDSIPVLKKRIEAAQQRYTSVTSAPPANGSRKPGWEDEAKRLLGSIEADQASIEQELQRKEFLKYCLAQELRWVWRWVTSRGRKALADWTRLEAGTAVQLERIWSRVAAEVELVQS